MKFGGTKGIQTAGVLSLAEGTVYMYMERVSHAIRNIRTEHLYWPGPTCRAYLKASMASYGFPGCIGIIDGSLIRLAEKPLKDGWSYYCRKKFYAVSARFTSAQGPIFALLTFNQLLVQAVVDHRGIFTQYELGWPGSVADTRAFKDSDLWQHKSKYFEDDEYMLADKGKQEKPFV